MRYQPLQGESPIAILRKNNGLSQSDLAILLDAGLSTIVAIETCALKPGKKFIENMRKHFKDADEIIEQHLSFRKAKQKAIASALL